MIRRTRLGFAAAGLVALAATLGTGLPATAATASTADEAAVSEAADCPQWKWDMFEQSMRNILKANGRAGYELAFFNAETAAGVTTDFQCLTKWELGYADPRNPGAKGFQINYDVRTGATKVSEVSPRAPLTQTEVAPYRAHIMALSQGYTDPFYGLWLTTGDQTGAPEYTLTTLGLNTSDYIVVDATTGRAFNYYFPDLPRPVIPQQAGRYSGGTETLQAYSCPAHHPYLWNHDDGLGFKGAKLRGYRTGGSMQPSELTTVDGLASGWQQTARGITTRDAGKDDNYLYALCTDDPAQGYEPPATEG